MGAPLLQAAAAPDLPLLWAAGPRWNPWRDPLGCGWPDHHTWPPPVEHSAPEPSSFRPGHRIMWAKTNAENWRQCSFAGQQIQSLLSLWTRIRHPSRLFQKPAALVLNTRASNSLTDIGVFWASRNLLSKIFGEEHCWREAPNTHLPISNTPLAPANQTLNRSRSCNHLYDSKMGHKEAQFLPVQLLWKEAKARKGWRVKNQGFKRELCVAGDVLTGIRFLFESSHSQHAELRKFKPQNLSLAVSWPPLWPLAN